MKILLIDTSTSHVTVSIVEDNEVLYNFQDNIMSDMSSKIMLILDETLKKSNIKLNDIDKIMVVNGPGSFTGIRVGVTVAKTIAWSLKKDIIPISSLELIATTKSNRKYIVPAIDARRGNVFCGVYDQDLNSIMHDKLMSLENLKDFIDDNYELVSYDDIEESIKPDINILKLINKHISDIPVNPHKLNPSYLKLTEAEETRLKND